MEKIAEEISERRLDPYAAVERVLGSVSFEDRPAAARG